MGACLRRASESVGEAGRRNIISIIHLIDTHIRYYFRALIVILKYFRSVSVCMCKHWERFVCLSRALYFVHRSSPTSFSCFVCMSVAFEDGLSFSFLWRCEEDGWINVALSYLPLKECFGLCYCFFPLPQYCAPLGISVTECFDNEKNYTG